jgi:hypothetical protein
VIRKSHWYKKDMMQLCFSTRCALGKLRTGSLEEYRLASYLLNFFASPVLRFSLFQPYFVICQLGFEFV